MARTVTLPPDQPATAEGVKPGGWWHESDGGKLVCDLCPRACALAPGQRGFCFVRRNIGGQIVSTTYGRSTGFCIDPIEKKPLNHFYPGTSVLSFGTAGCNLGCKFCQNWSISKSRQVKALSETAQPEAIAEAARQHDCRSVAFTYNDPIIWAEYAIDTAGACHDAGVKTVAVTSGYITPVARGPFYLAMDAANVDLKAFSEDFYWKLTSGHLEPVRDTLRWLVRQTDVWVEITNLVIPRANDSADELKRMCDWVVEELSPDVPVHFSAFHPDFRMTDRPQTPPATLRRAQQIARAAGLKYAYTGNISDPATQSTYCPGCGTLLIRRDGYLLGQYALEMNRCRRCGTPIAGRFDRGPGDWGPRRLPVRIAAYAEARKPNPPSQAGGSNVESQNTNASDGADFQRPQLSQPDEQRVFRTAARRVLAAVSNAPSPAAQAELAELGGKPLLGAFVSLKRAGQLRSCCGYMGQSVPLHQAIDQAAYRAAKEDPRFPPISPTELEHLDMEVWLLWGMEPVAARGEERAGVIRIGRHGLQIARGRARGLLLPGVATEHHLDAVGFLEAVCRKAGLPLDCWKDDDTQLMTFEGYAIRGRLAEGLADQTVVATAGGPSAEDVAALADFCRRNLLALLEGATPSFYLPNAYDGGVNGLVVTVKLPGSGEAFHCSRVSVKPEMPLQSTLLELVRAAAGAVRTRRLPAAQLPTVSVGLTVLFDPAMHGTLAEPALEGVGQQRRALLAIDRGHWALAFDPKKSPPQLLAEAIREARFGETSEGAVVSLAVASTEPRLGVGNVPRPQTGPEVRPPAVAGQFYPRDAAEIDHLLDDFLPAGVEKASWAAALVPHAGWVYSGRLAAEVLGRVEIPPRVIVFCPKHRPMGADWAVAPHRTWSLPSRDVGSDPQLAQLLAERIQGLELDAAAHAAEHAIEVQLPILARLAPRSRVVGIAMHGGGLDALERFADQLAGVLGELPSPPLLVISTDMNHYADEATTRHLDRMALDALETLDPARLYQTVLDQRISMCGVLPAVVVMSTLQRLGALNRVERVGYTTSAEASGDTGRVVGYAGILFA